MKLTTTQQNIIIVAVLLLFCLMASSCTTLKKITNKSTKETTLIEKSNDSISEKIVNKKIDDQITTKIADSGDPLLDAKIDAILAGINTSKSSGSNNYKFYYDTKLRELRAEFEIGETKDEKTDVVSTEKIEKSFEENLSEYIKKVVVPWWAYVIGFLFIWPYIKPIVMGVIKMAVGPASIVTMFGDFKKKNL